MEWNRQFSKSDQPALQQISSYVATPLWDALRQHLETEYGVLPTVEHSVCSGAPGWNVKYKKAGRALCTLYPAAGFFTCLISVGSRESLEAEALLLGCTAYVRELYWQCRSFNGGRWLMIEVTSPEVMDDVKALIAIRVKSKQKK